MTVASAMKSALAPLSTIWCDNVGLDRVLYLLYGVSWQIKKRLGMSFVTRLASQDESWIQKPLVNLFACPKALRKTVSRVLG